MQYQTIPFEEVKFEAHIQYIDIHYVVAGKEAIGYINTAKLAATDEYNEQKDVFHGRPEPFSDVTWLVLAPGELAVTYPSDAHAPKGIAGSPCLLSKIVIKIAV
jgi:YhcH/YjgK/YiaL family protein